MKHPPPFTQFPIPLLPFCYRTPNTAPEQQLKFPRQTLTSIPVFAQTFATTKTSKSYLSPLPALINYFSSTYTMRNHGMTKPYPTHLTESSKTSTFQQEPSSPETSMPTIHGGTPLPKDP